MPSTRYLLQTALLASLITTGVSAQEDAPPPEEERGTEMLRPEPLQDKPTETEEAPDPNRGYGRAGSGWLTVGAGYANNFNDSDDVNLHVAYSNFLADEVEFAVELGGWYYDQPGENTGAINGSMIFRWHFLHDEDYDWTVYGEIGIGLLVGLDLVPDGGTGFNFTPRAGLGVTRRITDDGVRLQLGARWAHISNGRIEGDVRNPSRDSLMGYVGIIIPF